MNNKESPRTVAKQEAFISKSLTLVERDVKFSDKEAVERYHSVSPYDYVSILTVTRDLKVPLVQQYRPSIEGQSLELPGGFVGQKQYA